MKLKKTKIVIEILSDVNDNVAECELSTIINKCDCGPWSMQVITNGEEVIEGLDAIKKACEAQGTDINFFATELGLDENEIDNEDDKLEHIANLLKDGYTSGYNPNWSIDYTITDEIDHSVELGDADYEHVAGLVKIGMKEGELCIGPEEIRGWWKLTLHD